MQHIPSLSEMGLRHVTPRVKRPTSMAVPLPSWAVGDAGDETNTAELIAVRLFLLVTSSYWPLLLLLLLSSDGSAISERTDQ